MRVHVDRPRARKGKARLGRFLLLLASCSGGSAQAADIDLPTAGLRMQLELPPGVSWSVRARWEPEHAADLLTFTSPAGEARYTIELAGRTARDCPLAAPFPIDIDGEPWIKGTDERGERLCRILPGVRALIGVETSGEASPALPAVLRSLLDALRARRLAPRSERLTRAAEVPAGGELLLPTVGLALAAPADGMEWRVAEPSAERDFDALVRVVPVFPEVQVAVRRHARREVAACARLARRLSNGHWSGAGAPPAGWESLLGRWIGGFRALALCRHEGEALLDVRVAANPPIVLGDVERLLAALAAARVLGEPPPSSVPRAPVRTTLMRWSALALGLSFPGTVGAAEVSPRVDGVAPFLAIDLGLAWTARNGPAFGANLSFGADGHGALLAATLEAGIAFALDDDFSFVFALALDDRNDATYANRSLSAVFDMRSGHHRPGAFAWSLRVMPLQLASREPAITGLPLAIGWQGLIAGRYLVGVDLRWASTPTRASEAWPAEGVAFGVRFGLGEIVR